MPKEIGAWGVEVEVGGKYLVSLAGCMFQKIVENWVRESPVSLVTLDLLGGNYAVTFGQVLGH